MGNVVNQKETVKNRFKFNGQQLDHITQQYYLRARFYNSVIARFTQEDTYRGDGINLYAYCRNNPIYYVDNEGNPIFTAKGGIADIEVYDDKIDSLVEVTLIKNRQQATNEIPAITRHLREHREQSVKNNVFSIFIDLFYMKIQFICVNLQKIVIR